MDIPKLIKEAQQEQTGAQKCLFDIFKDQMLAVCKLYVRTLEDAEECLLDGFYKAFKALSSFEYMSDGGFYQWLKRIMINQCLMYSRNQNVFSLVPEREAEEQSFEDSSFDKLATDEIFQMIDFLPVGCKNVFNLFVLEGYNHSEIAEMMGIAEGTSKSQLANARKLLQKMIIEKENYYERQRNG